MADSFPAIAAGLPLPLAAAGHRTIQAGGAGSLTMYKNGQRLGVAVANGVAGDLHWAACLHNSGCCSVRLAVLPPPPA